jgi:flagellum-specific peptidoglycan hydrolase FlgJ
MRRNKNQQLFIFALSLSFLISIGIYLQSSKNQLVEAASSPPAIPEFPAYTTLLPLPQLLTPTEELQISDLVVEKKQKVSAITKLTADKYETAAAYNTMDTHEVKALSVKSDPVIINEEPKKPTSIVMTDSGLTEDHISTIFKGTALEDEGLEEVILEIEEMYGINAYFTIAVLKLESGNGESRLATTKNNLFGLNAIDGNINEAFSFKTKGDSVRKFGQLISKSYVDKGYTTIEKVSKKYCPSNSEWPSLVASIMKSDYRKL